MAHKSISPDQLLQLQAFAANWGKIVARRTTEETSGQTPLDLRSMEEVAQAAAQGLIQGTLQALIDQQAQQLPKELPCPECSKLCEVRFRERQLQVQGATVSFDEPYGHCTRCRRDFFPSTLLAGLG